MIIFAKNSQEPLMTFKVLKDKYHVRTTSIDKSRTMDELIKYFQDKIEAHPVAVYITLFDHYGHTSSKEDGNIAENIKDVKNVIFCFGKEIPNAQIPAVRPRSISIVETDEDFVISFLEAPNEALNQTMMEWVKELN
jgi:hypothetical protein